MLASGLSIRAQNSITTSGGSSIGSGGESSYSIGQLVYSTYDGTDGSVAQGVQQAYEITRVTGIDDNIITLKVATYPNPVSDILTLTTESHEQEDLSFWLYDFLGNLLQHERVIEMETLISMQKVIPGAYFLKITSGSKDVKTFKIIKN